jgi:hypothetical protein
MSYLDGVVMSEVQSQLLNDAQQHRLIATTHTIVVVVVVVVVEV